jgi:hypothetical protein
MQDFLTGVSVDRWAIVCILLVVVILTVPPAYGQVECDVVRLEEAHSKFDLGLIDDTFALLDPCVPEGFDAKELRVDAYRLVALSYIAVDSLDQARSWAKRIVDTNSRYRSDPSVDPPVFTDFVQSYKPNWYNWLWKGKQWYHWAGRGLIVGTAVGVPLLIRSNSPQPLPGPPAFPD